ncbi:hypothetical protein [Polaromonas sp. CG_23.6]|uniref:hypothetical protein n=1 Tax=Polaromonas sp. CG_23.6 TaxID=2760709 RepID=UPI002473E45F|nr:hypothetical protein [Polaromonas sp. CG_23.6]MDH6185279.1 hypothetical protein [Polaromonas sp. CG_23.6]
MFTKPSYLSVLWTSDSTGNVVEKQAWCILATGPCIHVLIGMVCAAVALPFGLRSAALVPVVVGFVKVIFEHYAKGDADPANFAWIIAGAVLVLCFVKLVGLA